MIQEPIDVGVPSVVCKMAPEDTPHHLLIELVYFAEGAANNIYKIRPWTEKSGRTKAVLWDSATQTIFTPEASKVLRMSKGLDKTPDCRQIKLGYEEYLKRLFKGPNVDFTEHLMDHDLVYVEHAIVSDLNSQVGSSISLRQRNGVLTQEYFGLLLPDMSTVPGSSFAIELKPKWLAQSPTAPQHAARCRTCAMRASKASKAGAKSHGYICPLYLVDGNPEQIKPWIHQKVLDAMEEPLNPRLEDIIVTTMADYLTSGEGHKLLLYLRWLQRRLDPLKSDFLNPRLGAPKDPPNPHFWVVNLCLTMTLRDCSMFIIVHYDGNEPRVESKLVDLDFKSSQKQYDWRKKELLLVNGGWYKALDLFSGDEPCKLFARQERPIRYRW
ncbi:hypothetical protein CC78DRAFT_544371 [Lojkania enalia]|uniref:Inositol-pentakisphosphate 2-kinase n=1 Tax=Lojkania enalia TaxID=147567 RepID=A0A9P4K7U9_9PLEO|nr:hypothetical protein CC78DRAFT_544371 [Didymosphaeria enalia]